MVGEPKGGGQVIFVGNDWADDHHDVCVMDSEGTVLAERRFPEGLAGMSQLQELIAAHADDPSGVLIGSETDQGMWVEYLLAAGFGVCAVNPKSVARYRERIRPGGGKSDRSDARLLADMVRTDGHLHRRVAGNTENATAVRALARAHQALIWERTRHSNRLRAILKGFYPAAVVTFSSSLAGRDALAVLAAAPTPSAGRRLTVSGIRRILEKAGRKRNLETKAVEYQQGLKTEHLAVGRVLEKANGVIVGSQVAILTELNRQIEELEAELNAHFEQHPDADIYLSLPGSGVILSARMLGEFGDDPDRYADVKSRRNAAATSPLTIQSGKTRVVTKRWIRNERLHGAVIDWAYHATRQSPGAAAYYQHKRATEADHHQALRAVGNRLVGILHGCLQHRTPYDEDTAWGHRQDHAA
jgi:transposase